MMWLAAFRAIGKLFGFMLKHWQAVLILAAAAAVFGLWQHSRTQSTEIVELKGVITDLQVVVSEYENAQRELDGKVQYEKTNGKISSESAAAVSAGRQSGDGPMAPVLRAEYERVRQLSQDRAR